MDITDKEVKEAQRKYYRDYYKKNKERIRERQNQWRAENSDKVAEYNRNYWKRKAEELQEE